VRSAPRRGGDSLASLLAGALLALSLPPWGWWPLGLAGAGLLYWRLAGQRLRARLWSGWLAGLACYGLGLMWARTFNWYGAVVLVILEATAYMVAAGLTPPRRGRAPAFVASFTLLEAVRMTWPFGGLPLGGVFLGQSNGPLVELARLGGPMLITAGVWGGGVVVSTAVTTGLGVRRHSPVGRTALAGSAMLAGLVALIVAGALAPDGGAPVGSLRVALVQGGGARGLSKEQVDPSTVYQAQVAASSEILHDHRRPELVLWPEDVIALAGPLRGSADAAGVGLLAALLHTTVVAGVTEPATATTFRNEIVVWAPNGRIVASFEKVHRVPFGEYIPYRSLVSRLADVSGVPTDAVPGHGSGLLDTPIGPVGTLVSFEVFYSARSHESVRAGARLLIVPTNTSSYATAQVPSQEVAADVIQAVETGRDLVQAAPTGYSSVVTDRGVVRQRSTLGLRQVLYATVSLRRGFTPYDHWGDLPVLLVLGAAALWGWFLHRRRADQL
jgi:apolipoprotein N-acyltransferase